MKKTFCILAICIAALFAFSCKGKEDKSENDSGVQILQNADEKKSVADSAAEKMEQEETKEKYDFDFSKMNYNIISSITFEMLIEPAKYVNKTAKMTGLYYTSEHEGRRYHSVLVWDSTRCCPAGLSFIPDESIKEKVDSLVEEQEITVTGILQLVDIEGNGKELYFMAQTVE